MPSSGHYPQSSDQTIEHDWCFVTHLCRRCGASAEGIASGKRADHCEPGVTGISWQRRAERFRDLMAPWGFDLAGRGDNFVVANLHPGPDGIVHVPLYRMSDFANGAPVPFKPEDPSAA